MHLNDFLGQLRRERRLTKAEISRQIQTSDAAWHGVENGRSAPRLSTLIRVGGILGFAVVIHTAEQSYTLASKGGRIILRIADEEPPGNRRAAKTLSTLSPDQVSIVAQVVALLRP